MRIRTIRLLLGLLAIVGCATVTPGGIVGEQQAVSGSGPGAVAQAGREPPVADARPVLEAARLAGQAPRIDGRLDEDSWNLAAAATDFVQIRPDEGDPATEQTEVRAVYDDDALYVGVRAFDSDPDSIEGQLTRRDEESFSDWVHVAIDSYNDQRTAFQFGASLSRRRRTDLGAPVHPEHRAQE